MRDFRTLKVWEKAHALALLAYEATSRFPKEETYGMTSQIRRAAVSIPTNIAEGCGRSSLREFGYFLQVAAGSASELEYLVLLSHHLRLLDDAEHARLSSLIVEIKKMLTAYLIRLRSDS